MFFELNVKKANVCNNFTHFPHKRTNSLNFLNKRIVIELLELVNQKELEESIYMRNKKVT